MIKIKNESEQILDLQKLGSAAAANDVASVVSPITGYIKAIYAVFGLMGTDGAGGSQDVRVDIKKNGVSLFASAATSLLWAHAGEIGTANVSSEADTYGPVTPEPTKINKGDLLQIDILQVLNGAGPTQPKDLSVFIVVARGSQSQPGKTLYGQISELD